MKYIPLNNENIHFFLSDINLDQYPNDMNSLPKNVQQLVADAMQTINFESPSSSLTNLDMNNSTSNII